MPSRTSAWANERTCHPPLVASPHLGPPKSSRTTTSCVTRTDSRLPTCIMRKSQGGPRGDIQGKDFYYDPLHPPDGLRRIGNCICHLWCSDSLVRLLSLASNTRPLNFCTQ